MQREQVVNRLRATQDDERREGHCLGMEWAQQRATSQELRRLEASRDAVRGWTFGIGESAFSPAEQFYAVISGEMNNFRQDAAEFWEREAGNPNALGPSLVVAFADGAMEVWDDVKDAL